MEPLPHELLLLAAESRRDFRTVASFLAGRRVHRSTRIAVERAANKLNLTHLLPLQPARTNPPPMAAEVQRCAVG